MRRRVLIVERAAPVGGSVISLYQLLRGLDRSRFEPVLLIPKENPYLERFAELGVEMVSLPWIAQRPQDPAPFCAVKQLGAVQTLKRSGWGRELYHAIGFGVKHIPAILERAEDFANLVRRVRPDFVHLNDMLPAHRPEILGCKWARVPVLCHVRSFERLSRFDRWLASRVNRYVFISRAIADWFLALGVKVQAWDIVYNGVDGGEFYPMPDARREVRTELGLPQDAYVVAVAGRLVPWKGHEVFVDGLERLGREYPSLWGLVVGHGGGQFAEFERHLRAKVGLGEMRGRIVFAGHRSDMNRVLAGVDVLVHTSVEPEPFGRVIVEGMAAGVPVVASAAGGVPELIEDGRTGLLFPPGDDGGLAAAVGRLISTPDLAARLKQNALREVGSRFTVDLYVAGVEAVYEVMA
jgi:glycosyltransferase involved in cell wall biosynthesis